MYCETEIARMFTEGSLQSQTYYDIRTFAFRIPGNGKHSELQQDGHWLTHLQIYPEFNIVLQQSVKENANWYYLISANDICDGNSV